jgi:uncharacterized protein YukE
MLAAVTCTVIRQNNRRAAEEHNRRMTEHHERMMEIFAELDRLSDELNRTADLLEEAAAQAQAERADKKEGRDKDMTQVAGKPLSRFFWRTN